MDKRSRLLRTQGTITHRTCSAETSIGDNFDAIMLAAIAAAKELCSEFYVEFNGTKITVSPDSTLEALRACYHHVTNGVKSEPMSCGLAGTYDRLLHTLPHILDTPVYVGHWLQKALHLHSVQDVADEAFTDAAVHILLASYDVGQNEGLARELLENNDSEHATYLIGQYLDCAQVVGTKCFPDSLLGFVDGFCDSIPLDTDFNVVFGNECLCGANTLIDLRDMRMACSSVDVVAGDIITGCGNPMKVSSMFCFKTVCQWPHVQMYSTDTHRNLASANAVRNLLNKEGYGGEGTIFPLRVSIEMVPERIIS
jgi:hypothetical protein